MTVIASKLAVAHQSVGAPAEGGSCAVGATEAADVVVVVVVELVESVLGGAEADGVGGAETHVVGSAEADGVGGAEADGVGEGAADGANSVAPGAKLGVCVAVDEELIVEAVVEVIACVAVGVGVVVRTPETRWWQMNLT